MFDLLFRDPLTDDDHPTFINQPGSYKWWQAVVVCLLPISCSSPGDVGQQCPQSETPADIPLAFFQTVPIKVRRQARNNQPVAQKTSCIPSKPVAPPRPPHIFGTTEISSRSLEAAYFYLGRRVRGHIKPGFSQPRARTHAPDPTMGPSGPAVLFGLLLVSAELLSTKANGMSHKQPGAADALGEKLGERRSLACWNDLIKPP